MNKKTTLIAIAALLFVQNSHADNSNFLTRIVKKITEASRPANINGNLKIYTVAKKQVGTYYRPGVKAQCANFVGHVVSKAGIEKPASANMARSWLRWGEPVSWSNKKPGDIIITWRGSRGGSYGHILIYAGDEKAIHRSTSGKLVSYVDTDRYQSKVLGVRRAD